MCATVKWDDECARRSDADGFSPGALPQATMNLAFGQMGRWTRAWAKWDAQYGRRSNGTMNMGGRPNADGYSLGVAPGYHEFGLRPNGTMGTGVIQMAR
jgi:hypothetical protein